MKTCTCAVVKFSRQARAYQRAAEQIAKAMPKHGNPGLPVPLFKAVRGLLYVNREVKAGRLA